MKAIRVHSPGGPEAMLYEDVPDPSPGDHEVVVAVQAAGVNFIDVYHRTGFYPLPLPVQLGREGAGRVLEVGARVADFKPGDAVAWEGVPGGYAELAVVPAERLVPLNGLDAREGAAMMLQGLTAHYLATSTVPLQVGDTCLVHAAAGGVGLLLVQIARLRGATVIGTAGTHEKAELARNAGADHVIVYTEQDFEKETRRITNGAGVRVVYDSVGRTTWESSLRCLRPMGTLVLFGQSSGAVPPIDPLLLSRHGSLFLTRPTLAHYTATREALLARVADLSTWLADGQIELRIGAEFPLSHAADAHRAIESRSTTGKLLLIPGS